MSNEKSATTPLVPESLGPRMELKHLLPPQRLEPLVRELQLRIAADPHAANPDWPEIRVESLYFDDPRRVCYRGRSRRQLPKHRVRRYDFLTDDSVRNESLPQGESGTREAGDRQCAEECDNYLEEKLRVGNQVWKRRLKLSRASDLAAIVAGREALAGEREWFRRRFRVLDLRPTLSIRYARLAFQSPCGVRVTLDREVEASCLDGLTGSGAVEEGMKDSSVKGEDIWAVARGGAHVITGDVIAELKGPVVASPLFDDLLQLLAIPTCAYSKYSHGLEAVGLEVARAADDDGASALGLSEKC